MLKKINFKKEDSEGSISFVNKILNKFFEQKIEEALFKNFLVK